MQEVNNMFYLEQVCLLQYSLKGKTKIYKNKQFIFLTLARKRLKDYEKLRSSYEYFKFKIGKVRNIKRRDYILCSYENKRVMILS